ncbi:vWA domain-containing protein [Neolewinella agarilytica]|uniref:vWA domain-containing protein n=1 Tax=Neolewinella agarilytica TaxID=478744 RepID=UPI002352A27F|nr:vWA domain-containing protein [Neolewinella agarilytica]
MKIPTTFAWLSAAVLTAIGCLFLAGNLLYGNTSLPPTPPAPVSYPAPATAPPSVSTRSGKNLIQIAFLLDTSSSMDGLIDQAKSRLWNILNEILKAQKDGEAPDIEVALYQYGNSGLLPEKGYIEQVVPLTTDVDLFSDKLFGLKTGGGDEFCGHVILRSTDDLTWDANDGTIKLIYIAGNEPFTQGEVKPEDALRKARGKDIIVNTILCGNPNGSDGPSWRSGAKNGDGDFFFINQDERVTYIASPYDDAIEKCNLRLNRTYIAYGAQGATFQANQMRQDVNAGSYSKANLSSRARFKASKKYKNTAWDVVDAAEENEEVVLSQKETMPDSLSRLSDEALKVKIKQMSEERKTLQAEILALTAKRDAYVAEARKKASGNEVNTLGEKLKLSVRKRLLAREYEIVE